jgi:hypothetical protein
MPRWEPAELRHSEMFLDAPDEARALWAKGYRPVKVETLRPAMTVAYRQTDVFRLENVGPVLFSRVERVRKTDDWTVIVDHTGGTTDCDEGSEVWAKANDDPQYDHWDDQAIRDQGGRA